MVVLTTLPDRWITKSIPRLEPSQVLVGFSGANDGYCLYVTNFKQVWLEEVDNHGMGAIAAKFGYEVGLESERNEILRVLQAGLYQSTDLRFTTNDHTLRLDFKDGDFQWMFTLQVQDSATTIDVLAAINYQNFANHSYLAYQIRELQHSVEVKDLFIKFLTTNFKLSHGSQLITKFKRNNRSESSYLSEFDQSQWQKTVAKKYATSYKKQKSTNDKLQEAIRNSISDVQAWNYSNIWNTDKDVTVSPDLSPIEPTSSEPDVTEENSTKLETTVQPTVQTPECKKQKFGILKSVNKRQISPQNSIQASERISTESGPTIKVETKPAIKPKRFGTLISKKKKSA